MKHKLLCFFILTILISAIYSAEVATETPEAPTKDGKKTLSVFSAFVQSFSSIVVSELGDKTFFIAAIMAMRYNRLAVLAGALLALFLMTGISVIFGSVVDKILPPTVSHILITILFFFFGGKLLYDAYTDDGADEGKEEEEVEIELNHMHSKLMKSQDRSENHREARIEYVNGEDQPINEKSSPKKVIGNGDIESRNSSPRKSDCASKFNQVAAKLVFWQALTMTFLGEWGDRSQFTTIALAAEGNAWFVFIGSFMGHVVCTSLAVTGGKYLAKRISERTVNICGGVLFLLFGIHNLFKGD